MPGRETRRIAVWASMVKFSTAKGAMMNTIRMATLGGVCSLGFTLTMAQAVADSADVTLSDADKAVVFKAAGAVQRKGAWVICEPPT